MIEHIFQKIGFSDKEAAVYQSLLQVGSATPAQVARATRLNRTTIYDVMDTLVHRGIASKFKKGPKTYFYALDPRQLVAYLNREEQESMGKIEKQKKLVQNFLPELISLQNPLSTKPKVQFFEGEKGVREAYEDTLTATEPLRAYTNVAEMLECLPNFFPDYFKRRAKAKIGIRAVFVDNKKSRERALADREELRQSKFLLDKTKSFSPEIKIYNDKMVIASWREKMAIVIQSKELAELQKIIFDTLWELLPPQQK